MNYHPLETNRNRNSIRSALRIDCYVFHIGTRYTQGGIISSIDTPFVVPYLVDIQAMTQLIGTQLIETAVKAAIATGRIANSDNGPLSLLLIATPESGKTSIVSRKCDTVLTFTDITGRGLMETVKKNPKITHLIILDMVAVMSHKQHVNQYTLSILNSMTEEGLAAIAYPTQTDVFPDGNKKGLVACLTIDLVRDGRHWWNKTGFATRMLPICFDHSPGLTAQIKLAISKDRTRGKRPGGDELLLPEVNVNVELSDRMGEHVQRFADLKAVEFKEKGYRRLKQFRALVRGHALLRAMQDGWADVKTAKIAVDKSDLQFLESLMPFVSFERATQI